MSNVNIAGKPGGDKLIIGDAMEVSDEFHFEDLRGVYGNAGALGSIGFLDDFIGDTFKAELAITLEASSTAALNQQAGGVMRLTTNAAADAYSTLALGLHWLASSGPTIFKARIKNVTAITARMVEIGLSDALSESNGQAFTSHDVTPVAVATNAAIFGFNTVDTMTQYSALSVNAGGTPQVDLNVETPALTYSDLMVVIDALGNAYFYEGEEPVLVATQLLAVATTALLTPWISITATASTAAIIDVDFMSIQGRRA